MLLVDGLTSTHRGKCSAMSATVLWIIAAVLVVVGIVQIIQGQLLLGLILIVVGLLVGPGGVSIFSRRGARY
jgi:hypothetical protein